MASVLSMRYASTVVAAVSLPNIAPAVSRIGAAIPVAQRAAETAQALRSPGRGSHVIRLEQVPRKAANRVMTTAGHFVGDAEALIRSAEQMARVGEDVVAKLRSPELRDSGYVEAGRELRRLYEELVATRRTTSRVLRALETFDEAVRQAVRFSGAYEQIAPGSGGALREVAAALAGLRSLIAESRVVPLLADTIDGVSIAFDLWRTETYHLRVRQARARNLREHRAILEGLAK